MELTGARKRNAHFVFLNTYFKIFEDFKKNLCVLFYNFLKSTLFLQLYDNH